MTNPTPRPALRKADDADVHPAAPRPARSPRSRTTTRAAEPSAAASVAAVPDPEQATTAEPTKAPAKPRGVAATTPGKSRKRKFSGSTSDHMRVAEAPEPTSEAAAVETVAPAPKTKPAKVSPPPTPALLTGKSVELEVHVPKALRKAARAEAKKRGLDIDTVVVDLLHAWLTEPR